MMAGGTSAAKEATDEVKAMCEALKNETQEKAQAAGWNGLFPEFTAHSFSTQVVAGTNYFVKVKVGDGKFCHVRIHQPLPHTGAPPSVHSVQVDKGESDALEYF
ncbi:unnamed protein product [Effrenium voratum]|uniref:Cystatin domain-containing protein n=1 Tax=Effrenium voratum TaxID=2562239 RepID=A0AA36NIJ8_9DINO|nr:unnamed protein product [Effrenium voratum]CAJ1428086.1 unnamed protein product [Effrenium voratum]